MLLLITTLCDEICGQQSILSCCHPFGYHLASRKFALVIADVPIISCDACDAGSVPSSDDHALFIGTILARTKIDSFSFSFFL